MKIVAAPQFQVVIGHGAQIVRKGVVSALLYPVGRGLRITVLIVAAAVPDQTAGLAVVQVRAVFARSGEIDLQAFDQIADAQIGLSRNVVVDVVRRTGIFHQVDRIGAVLTGIEIWVYKRILILRKIDRHAGAAAVHFGEHLRSVEGVGVNFRTVGRELDRKIEIAVNARKEIRTEIETVIVIGTVLEETPAFVIPHRGHVVKFIASAAYRQRMTLHMAPVIETLADPVGVVQIAQSRRRRKHRVEIGIFEPLDHFGIDSLVVGPLGNLILLPRIDTAGFAALSREAVRTVVAHLHAFGGALLGRDENNARSSFRTINRCGRGILQHRNRLDIVRVEHIEIALDTVDQHQRRNRIDRGMAADLKGETLLAGLAARLRDDHAGQFALQGGQHVGRSLVRNRVTRNLRHGTRKIHLFLDAVADDDHLAHLRRLFLQRDVHRSTSLDGDALLLIAHKRDVEDGPFGNIECKLALVIGGHSLTAALHKHRRTDKRRTRSVGHDAGNDHLPSRCGKTHQRQPQRQD